MFWLKYNFQDTINYFSQYLNFFHDCNLLVLFSLITFIICFMFSISINFFFKNSLTELQLIEILWTFFPCLILVILGWPSMQLLYSLENTELHNSMTLKSIGHQWYWSYEYSNLGVEFDSFMLPESDLNLGDSRLLEVDNKVILPFNSSIRVLVMSADVLHSWAIPSMSIKMDCCPGRLNQVFMFSLSPGIYYGQCSELCGVNHSFMPISIEFTSPTLFNEWISKFQMLNN